MPGVIVPGVVVVLAMGLAAFGDHPLVDVVVVGGLGVVAPLAMGSPVRWSSAAATAAGALWLGSGTPAAMLAVVSVVVAGWAVVDRLRLVGVHSRRTAIDAAGSLSALTSVLVPVWTVVGAGSLVASVAEVELFGIGEPIVRLTAVHYLYAGVGALSIAHRTMDERRPGARLPGAAVVATAVAPPIVAAGFVAGHPVPQIGGAVLMTVGVWLVAVLLLSGIRAEPDRRSRVLRLLAGLSPWGPMVLAVAWATAQHVADVPALSIPDMARVHGLANGIGFVLLGLLGTASATPAAAGTTTQVDA